MTLPVILRHGEARFALVAVTGFAFLTGWVVHCIGTSAMTRRIILVVFFVWGIASLWRTDIQIQAWGQAGQNSGGHHCADSKNSFQAHPWASTMIFVEYPARKQSLCVYLRYRPRRGGPIMAYGRSDFKVIRYPKRADFGKANPARDAVLQYHKETGVLERLHGEKRRR